MAIKLICLHFDEGMQVSIMCYMKYIRVVQKKEFLFLFCFFSFSLFFKERKGVVTGCNLIRGGESEIDLF